MVKPRRTFRAVIGAIMATAIVVLAVVVYKNASNPEARARRSWALPVRIGETRESVFTTLSEPSLNWTEFESKKFPVLQSMAPKDETVLWWQQRGLQITFVNDLVRTIEIQGNRTYNPNDPLYIAPYRGPILMGITVDDDLSALTRKLGPPEQTEPAIIAKVIVSDEMEAHVWRVPPYLISAST
jgi:hypothetical protein